MKDVTIILDKEEYMGIEYVAESLEMTVEEFIKESSIREMELMLSEEYYSKLKEDFKDEDRDIVYTRTEILKKVLKRRNSGG